MLTEQEVSRSWSRLFKGVAVNGEVLDSAQALLDELRAESPLRHRLSVELNELRQQLGGGDKKKPKAKTKKRQTVAEGV